MVVASGACGSSDRATTSLPTTVVTPTTTTQPSTTTQPTTTSTWSAVELAELEDFLQAMAGLEAFYVLDNADADDLRSQAWDNWTLTWTSWICPALDTAPSREDFLQERENSWDSDNLRKLNAEATELLIVHLCPHHQDLLTTAVATTTTTQPTTTVQAGALVAPFDRTEMDFLNATAQARGVEITVYPSGIDVDGDEYLDVLWNTAEGAEVHIHHSFVS